MALFLVGVLRRRKRRRAENEKKEVLEESLLDEFTMYESLKHSKPQVT